MERVYRWMAAGLVGLSSVVFYLAFNVATGARADTPNSELQQIASALKDMSENGLIVNWPKTMQALGPIAQTLFQTALAPEHAPNWGWGTRSGPQPPAAPLPVPPQRAAAPQPRAAQQPQVTGSTAQAGQTPQPQAPTGPITLGEVVQDLAILITNTKQDSDWLRQHTQPPTEVSAELAQMNVALSAIPAMAADMHQMDIAMTAVPPMVGEMHQMNLSMGLMSRSIGSTMGRMGRMFPF